MTEPILGDASVEANDGPGPAFIAFDFDGTLAEQRGGWSLLYRLFGVEDAGEARTVAFWEGDLSYDAWAEGNIADWRARDVRQRHVERAAEAVKITAGAPALLTALRRDGVPFGVVSAGVRGLIRPIERFDPAFVVANEVVYDGGVPVDVIPRVPPGSKGDILTRLCEDAGVTPADVIYVGDSRSDEEAFDVAGTAVLFDPDDRLDDAVYETIDHHVEERDLSRLRSILLPDD